MSKTEVLRVLVKQFLCETADQIVEAVEKMISGYEEEMCQSKLRLRRRKQLTDVLISAHGSVPDIRLNGISEEAQVNLYAWEKDLLIEQQQEWNSCEDAVKHFLTVAAGRIAEAVEKTISGCKREMHQSKRDISRQNKMLNALLQPEIRLTRIPDELGKVEEPLPSVEQLGELSIEADAEVSSPGFSEPENEDDDDWNATQDGDGDRNEATQDAQMTENTKSWICKVCGKSFHHEGKCFLKHLKRHPEDCGLCGMHCKTEEDFEVHLKFHKNEIETRKKVKVVCDVCGKCFPEVYLLKLHIRSHSGEKPFTCEVCGKSFALRQIMKAHLTTHSSEKPYRCELCGTLFSTQGQLTRHHLIHAGEKPYICTICGEHFISYSMLRKHMRTHGKRKKNTLTSTTPVYDNGDVNAVVITKEQLVQIICKVCRKDFHSKVSLLNHLESHPKNDCGLCGMHFNIVEDFELHLETHQNEISKVCDVCGKCFAKPFYLERHMRSHMGEKRLKCNVCDKAFRRHSSLKDHSRIHTGEKPFPCTSCSKCFRTNTNLKQHMKRCRII